MTRLQVVYTRHTPATQFHDSDDKPLAKVIDFGIAKATNSELTEKTLFTEFRQLIGTPQYMSPEQAERSGVDVDTRTDIYSLGVLLYEMLTGRTPIDPKVLSSAAWHELQRMICEDEPTKPSLLVASASGDLMEVARRRSTEAKSLGGILRGDLDWIVLKSIEKDRSRRYATAGQLAEDVGRYLSDEPVEATPPSVPYRFSKFARRNKRLFVTVTAIALALVVGLISTSTTAMWALRERKQAEAASRDALNAKAVAEQETRRARRSAIILGASLMFPEDEAKALADEWRADIDAQRASRTRPDSELTREEAQLAAWYGNWLLQRRKTREAREVIAACYDRVKQVIGMKDATFLMLCNANVQAHVLGSAPATTVVPPYEDVLVAVEHVQGLPQAIALYPEYASQLVSAGRDAEAAEAIRKYLAYRRSNGTSPTTLDNIRLDMTLDGLVRWSDGYPDLYKELKAYRETGIVAGDTSDPGSDYELAADLQALQGAWESNQTGGVPGSVRMVQEFQGSKVTSKWLAADGKLVHGRSGMIELSRSGACKVLTSHSGDASQGSGSFIYKIENDQLKVVSGMLTNRPSLPQTLLFVYTRVADNKE